MNPPTVGHQKLVDKVKAEAKKRGVKPHVFITHTQDKKKNPLDYNTKYKIARKAFGSSVTKSKSKTIIQVMQELEKMGHTEVTLVVGSDRLNEFKTFLNKYNGKDFKFDKLEIVSAGARDPDAEGVSGMSASKMRAAAQSGDYDSFKKGTPRSMSEKEKKDMYDKIRSVMGATNEAIEWDESDFDFTDEELDAFVEMTDLDELDEDIEIDEEFEEYLEEVRKPLTIQQRMKIARRMKRLAPRMARMRKIRAKRMADPKRLERRSRKAAIKILRKRFAGKQGANYASLTPGAKMSVDRIIQKKMSLIGRLSKRLMPKVRKAEMERLKRARGGGNLSPKPLIKMESAEKVEMILTEESVSVNAKLMTMLRVGIPDTTQRNLIIRALRGGKDTLKNPYLRPYLMNLLIRLVDITQSDPNIYNKVKERMRVMGLEEPISPTTVDTGQIKEAQDPDIKDRPGAQPAGYHRGLSKSTKIARDRHFKKYEEKPEDKSKKDKQSNYKPAPGDARAKTKTSVHTMKYRAMYGEDFDAAFNNFMAEQYIEEKAIEGLKKKAEKSGIPYGILKKVYDRGMAAWKSGHRPGATPQQWAFARVNSFITKGSGTWGKADKDLAAKVRKEELDRDDEPDVKDVIKGLKKASKSHADQAKKLEKSVKEDAVANARAAIKREKEADKRKHDAMLDRARLQKTQTKNRATEEVDIDEMAKKVPGEPGAYTMKQGKTEYKISPRLNRNDRPSGEWQIYVKGRSDWNWDRTVRSKKDAINWIKTQKEEVESQIQVGDYKTKHYDMCPGATSLYKTLEPTDLVVRTAKMQDVLFGLEKKLLAAKSATQDDVDRAQSIANQIMAMAKMMGKAKEHNYIQGHVDKIKELANTQTESYDDQFESLWANIHKKRQRIKQGSGERMRKPGDKGAPSADALKRAKLDEQFVAGISDTMYAKDFEEHKVHGGFALHPSVMVDEDGKPGEFQPAMMLNPKTKAKILANRKKKTNEEGGAGEEGTDKLVKKYKKDTPGEMTEAIEFMKKHDIEIVENVYRPLSEKYFEFFREARRMMQEGEMEFSGLDKQILETDLGEFDWYGDMEVPLDCPMVAIEEEAEPELNKPKRGGSKKYYVYVRNPDTGNIKKVEWGDTTGLKVKINDPAARKSFAARHQCDTRNDKTKASYWACRLPRYAKSLGLQVDNPGSWW